MAETAPSAAERRAAGALRPTTPLTVQAVPARPNPTSTPADRVRLSRPSDTVVSSKPATYSKAPPATTRAVP
ncbi:Uncharacterised protein [Bordetella pertussis]|nr:Uncharacterised protein [Bordetella pertussis]CFM01640.1 Uncharacterised protein [Bordetella pertussis]CFM20256.1 Uncharacterised protein [Bordetella pertussis]CFN28213.1 Uncharacterised protein [Bordetella pertussis]CFN57955.1 Uncharacterised protein [Bordetella pertussis]